MVSRELAVASLYSLHSPSPCGGWVFFAPNQPRASHVELLLDRGCSLTAFSAKAVRIPKRPRLAGAPPPLQLVQSDRKQFVDFDVAQVPHRPVEMGKRIAARVDSVPPHVQPDPLLDRDRSLLVDRLHVEVVAHFAALGHNLELHRHQVLQAGDVEPGHNRRLSQEIEPRGVEELDLRRAEHTLEGSLRLMGYGEGAQPGEQALDLGEVDLLVEEEVEVAAFAMSQMHGDRGTSAEVDLLGQVRGKNQPGRGGIRRQNAAHAIGQLGHRDEAARLWASRRTFGSSPRASAARSQSPGARALTPQARPCRSIVRNSRLAMYG